MEHVVIDNDEKCNLKTIRVSYMRRITREFHKRRDCVLPTAAEERSFEDALHHVVRLFPSKKDRDRDTIAPFSGMNLRNGLNACDRKEKRCRKKCLKEILNGLQFMQRKRVYDPPADDEIRYYLLIKKYIRAMLTFFYARGGLPDKDMYSQLYECFSYSSTLHNVDELVEINRYLADFSAFVLEVDITNGSTIKPLMGIPENHEVAPLIRGSKERSTMFYWHKFELAFFDLSTSEYACFPPFPEEERSYLRVLDHISSPSFSSGDKRKAVNVYSHELHALFIDRIERETKDLERHCIRIRMSILEKLSIVEPWESIVEIYQSDPVIRGVVYEEEEELVELARILTTKCQVAREDMPDYIASVERCSAIACSVFKLISARTNSCVHLAECYPGALREFGWDALHALTLFKCGSFSTGNVFREHIILRNPKENGPSQLEYEEAKMKKRKRVAEEEREKIEYVEAKMKTLKRCVALEECENGSVKTLEGIVEDLRCIGDSDTLLDEEESHLMYKIWLNVAASVHFFFCGMAYEQKSYIVTRGGLPQSQFKLCDPEKKATELTELIECIHYEMRILSQTLEAYEQGLHEMLETLPGSKTDNLFSPYLI